MATSEQLASAEQRLKDQLRQVRLAMRRQPGAGLSHRERDAMAKRARSLERRLIVIPTLTPEERAERDRREADVELWLESYWSAFSPDPFYRPEPQQRQMIEDFAALLSEGGDRATAASRGEGKTTLAVALTLKAILQGGGKDLWIILGATAKNAADILDTIRTAVGESEELLRYYPEVCVPVRALENTVQRAKTQAASGNRHDNDEPFEAASTSFHWTGERLVFPNVPGSPSAGAIVISQGLDSALRGMRIKNRRPRAVIIDDPDTEETIHNPAQAAKLLRKIDRSIAALGSQRQPVSRLVLCTCASRTSAAAQLTDQTKYPSFRGRRMRFLLRPPKNQAAWDKFVSLCKEGWLAEADVKEAPIPRIAHEYYLANREAMDDPDAVSNPHRFDHRIRPEGGTVEVSALEHYFGWVARIGAVNTATEFDNDPPDELGLLDLTPEQIRDSRSGCAYRTIPPGTKKLTVGADVKKLGLHWVCVAWDEHCVGSIVEFHFWRFATAGQKPEACENAVLEGLREWWQWMQSHKPWREDPTSEATAWLPDWTLIDSGWKDEGWSMQPVSVFASEVGFGRCLPCKGFGRYRKPQQGSGLILFDECHIDRRGRTPLCEINADAYKTRVQEAFKADVGTPGSLGLHLPRVGADGRQLKSSLDEEREFAAHIVSEQWNPEKRKFNPPHGPNHYLDATALARAAVALCRMSPIPSEPARSKPRRTLPQMANGQ
jgi:hypothetical protein